MISASRVNYFPLLQLAIFTLTVACAIFAFVISYLGLLMLVFFILISYFFVLGDATIVKIYNNKLTVIPFNLFSRSHDIDLKFISRIASVQTNEFQSDDYFGGSHFLFARRYEIAYTQDSGATKKAYLMILNKTKEEHIIGILNASMDQSDR